MEKNKGIEDNARTSSDRVTLPHTLARQVSGSGSQGRE
jgi:hypothetical protein